MRLQRHSCEGRISVTPADLIGSGGEARVYVVPPDGNLVAKLYYRPTEAQIQKLRVMLANPPEDPTGEQAHISIAWPIDLLSMAYGERNVVGYVMPRARGMQPLFQVYNPAARRQHCPLFTYRYLHRAARNLAAAVRALHQRGYVIGDVNESNILVSDRALITLVDTDSFQVTDPHTRAVYRCPVGKAEYTPPELQGTRFSQIDRTPEHDRFGLAVLLFQLLMEGAHPFAGLYEGTGDPPPYEDRIVSGHFAYGSRRVPYRPMPLAPSLELLDPALRLLFVRCFEDGQRTPDARPDSQMWQNALADAEKSLVTCAANPRHLYGKHLASCPWCARTRLLGGRDPFPSEPVKDLRLPRRMPTSVQSPNIPVRIPTSGNSLPASPWSPSISNWQSNAPVSASLNGGVPGALPVSYTLLTMMLPRNGWAWGAVFWALMAVLAVPLGMPGLNGMMALLSVGFAAAGWHAAVKRRGIGRWVSGASALFAVSSLALRPLAHPPRSERHVLSAGAGGVRSLSFSPDGRILAVGTSRLEDSSLTEGEVSLWDVASEKRISTPEQANGDVASVAFSPDGRAVAAANDSPFGTGEVVVLSTSSDGAYRQVSKERRHMRQVAYSRSGDYLASAGADRIVRIWNAKSMEATATLEQPSNAETIAFSPDGRLLAVGTASPPGSVVPGYVTVWEASTGRMLWSQGAHGNGVRCVVFSPDGNTVASGGNDGALCFWQARSGRLVRRQTAHSYGIAALAYSPDGTRLASAETRQTEQGAIHEVVIRDAATDWPTQTLTGHKDLIEALAFSPRGGMIASGSRDGTVRLWFLAARE